MERYAADRPVLQLVRPPHGREAHDLAADRRRRCTRSCPRSTTAGWPSGLRIVANARARAAPRAPARSTTRWTSASTTGPDVNRDPLPLRARRPATRRAATTRVVSREPDRRLHRDRARASCRSKEYYGRWRTFPDTCDYSFQETRPVGVTRTLLRRRRSSRAPTPTAGTRVDAVAGAAAMFEALMPALFVPEERWAPRQLGRRTTRCTVARADPPRAERGRLRLLGLLAVQHARGRLRRLRRRRRSAWTRTAYPSNEDQHAGRPRLRRAARTAPAKPDPPPSAYTNGVVTPHAAFLALRYAPARRRSPTSRRLAARLPGPVRQVGLPRQRQRRHRRASSDSYLSLDQGMIMAALGNALGGDVLRRAFATRDLERALRPVIGVEEFGATPRGCTITGTPGPDRAARHARRRRHLRPRRRRPRSTAAAATTRSSATRGATGWRAATADDTLYGDDGDDDAVGRQTATTCCRAAPGADRLDGGRRQDTEQGG